MNKVFIIAEAGVNHDGSVDDALRLVDAAADAGADCVKFQTFSADALAAADAGKADYQKRTTGATESQRDMLRRLELPLTAYDGLMRRCKERGIQFLSTAFDPGSLRFLTATLKLKFIKVGSGDLTNAPMLLEIARAGLPLILSTGMATMAEVQEALGVLAFGYAATAQAPSRAAFAAAFADNGSALAGRVTLLHCTTEYPCPLDAVNLRAMETLASFGLPVGYSDHTMGIEASVAAVARGAVMIEKHITLDRGRSGPDHAASLVPAEFGEMITAIRRAETMLGNPQKEPQPAEIRNIPIARKAVVAARAIAPGEVFTADNLTVKRPGIGLAPIQLFDLIGTAATRAYQPDEAVQP